MTAKSIKISLKYRIAIVFFVIAGVMMGLVLTMTLSRSYEVNKQHLEKYQHVIIKQIEDLCRIALFTRQFDDLQPYIEQSIQNPLTEHVMLADRRGIVVVSSNVLDVGQKLADLTGKTPYKWQFQSVHNAAGVLGTLAIDFTERQLHQANDEALARGLTMAFVGIIIIAIVGLLMGHFLTRRLSVLSQAAGEIASGNLQIRTNLSGSDEVALVGNTFDHMAESLSNYIKELHDSEAQLKQAHSQLEHRVEQRTAELAIARDDALEASLAKSKFLASMSHELRTPLNAIIGYSELLMEDAIGKGEKDMEDHLDKINSAGTHLLNLIDDILDLSKIEAGKMSLMLEWFDVKSCVNDTLTSLYPLTKKTGNTIRFEADNQIDTMYADKTKVRQILINLISNASKYAPNSEIIVSISRVVMDSQDQLIFAVADRGVGIQPEKIPDLFDEFSHLSPEVSSIQKGTGLGLAICKKYCTAMGGDISVSSEFGQGSTFTVRLPVLVSDARVA